MSSFKKIIKKILKTAGLRVTKIQQEQPNILNTQDIELVFDIGANIGQYAKQIRDHGYKGKIISFEPLPDAYMALKDVSKDDSNWVVHERCAIGSEFGEIDINISENSYSSSLLPMLDSHRIAAPQSRYIGTAKTKIITLDSVFDNYRKNNEKTFLKIDTQGFEKEVLLGCTSSLKNIFAVQLELSITNLYEGQDLYEYFFSFFKNHGYDLWNLIPGFFNPQTGQLLQFDAIFIKQN